MPNSRITEPIYYSQYHGKEMPSITSDIKDRAGETIGCINWRDGVITIYDEYKYSDEIRRSIGEEKFSTVGHHFDPETDMPDCRQAEKELSRFLKEHEETKPETEEPASF